MQTTNQRTSNTKLPYEIENESQLVTYIPRRTCPQIHLNNVRGQASRAAPKQNSRLA
jgi:hypothetical protein